MCGIVAYLGFRQAAPALIEGLKRLEYRGYDSAGIALWNAGLTVVKKSGKVSVLEEHTLPMNLSSTIGIAHTRWATHGEPNDRNAHPHLSQDKKMAIVHNGIIENYGTLKEELTRLGHTWESDTDTEVLVHLIEEIKKVSLLTLAEAIHSAFARLDGAFAFVVLHEDEPGVLYAARRGSPLMIGIGQREYMVASDPSPLLDYTNKVVYLKDNEMAKITYDGVSIIGDEFYEQKPMLEQLDMNIASILKNGFSHYMLKEIYEQPHTIRDSLRGRITTDFKKVKMAGLELLGEKMIKARRFYFIGCGTSLHAGMIGRYLVEKYTGITAQSEFASEFRYRDPVIQADDIYILLSQSGETADTLVTLDMMNAKGAATFGICNVPGSSLARSANAGAYTRAGVEIGVASTKAFTAQLSVLFLMVLAQGNAVGKISEDELTGKLKALSRIPEQVNTMIHFWKDQCHAIASLFADAASMLYVGRGVQYPIALEGALKMKEISYLHAEAFPAGELKHGPLALIDQTTPVVVLVPNDQHRTKNISNIQEIKARKGKVIAVTTAGDEEVKEMADYCIEVPATDPMFYPLLTVVPLQLMAYYVGVMKGCNVDQPRNLAKSVTVE